MKAIKYIILIVFVFFALSCKDKEVVTAPTDTILSGTWILYESQLWNGSKWVVTRIAEYPQQTLTFAKAHEFLPKGIQDTDLAQSRYFDIISGSLTGPSIVFKKNKDSPAIVFFNYSLVTDTLRIITPNVNTTSYGYNFRRF